MESIIGRAARLRRTSWVAEIQKLSGRFGDDFARLERALNAEVREEGPATLMDHLRLCGDIPESYGHDSSEEKLYSKYTDTLLAEAFQLLGMKSVVLKERADTADVEVFAKTYAFVADAKAFRLSRTAKNQKDFKVQAMDGWKRGKPYALVVCPIYQLPSKASQIYQQASARNVCILTYSHIAMLIAFSLIAGRSKAEQLVLRIFKAVEAMNASKDATYYWGTLNRMILEFSRDLAGLWKMEKLAALEAIALAKNAALTFLAEERERIIRMSRAQAVKELVRVYRIENRIAVIKAVADNGILDLR